MKHRDLPVFAMLTCKYIDLPFLAMLTCKYKQVSLLHISTMASQMFTIFSYFLRFEITRWTFHQDRHFIFPKHNENNKQAIELFKIEKISTTCAQNRLSSSVIL